MNSRSLINRDIQIHAIWFRDNSCLGLIQDHWGKDSNDHGFNFNQKQEHIAKQLTLLNKSHFGFIQEKLQNIKSQLKFIHFCNQNNEKIQLENLLKEQINEQFERQ